MTAESVCVSVQPKKIIVFLGLVVGALFAANIIVNIGKLLTDGNLFGLGPLFDLKAEQNIPTFFSGLLLILNAGLFAATWMLFRRFSGREYAWLGFSALFLFLAFDELFQVHEQLIEPMRNTMDATGIFYFAWVLVYGVAVLAIAALFLPRWWRLEPRSRWWLAASGVVYLTGAIAFEMAGGAVYEASGGQGGAVYALFYTVEETLEMVGLVMLTYTLLNLINSVAPALQLDFLATAPARSTALPRMPTVTTPPPPAGRPAQFPIPVHRQPTSAAVPPGHRGTRTSSGHESIS